MRVATKPRTDASELWREYHLTRTDSLRNQLMERYLHIVKYNAERIGAKLPDEVERDDLVSAGVFGLMDAIDAFDPARGVKFETYCAPRIRGAILDELRSMDWVPRLVRSRGAKLERKIRDLEALFGRQPSEVELSCALGLPLDEFDRLIKESTPVMQISLSRRCNDSDANKDVCEVDIIEDRRGRDPVQDIHRRDLKDLVTRGLSRAERLILVLYYYEELTMKEIGVTLDLSESRVSQMHSAVLERLKEQLDFRKKELVH